MCNLEKVLLFSLFFVTIGACGNIDFSPKDDFIGEFDASLNKSPNANVSGPIQAKVNCIYRYDASMSYDPDGNIVKYRWLVSKSPSQSYLDYSIAYNGQDNVNIVFWSKGSYTVALKVLDDDGQTDSESMRVSVY